jgi:hypothetical protein
VGVDLAGELDEPCLLAMLASQPGEIERVDWDAVPTEAWAGIEGLEPEWLGLGRLDHLPDVDAQLVVENLELVHEGDVDGAIRVLEDLAGLGNLHAEARTTFTIACPYMAQARSVLFSS